VLTNVERMWRDVQTSKKVSRYKHMINVQSNVNVDMHLILCHFIYCSMQSKHE